MNYVITYLASLGYGVTGGYYNRIQDWIKIWEGKANWLEVKTNKGKEYPMYSLNMAKRSSEDLASMLTSESFEINVKGDNKTEEELKSLNLLEQLPEFLEVMAYTGTICTVIRVNKADLVTVDNQLTLKSSIDTKKKLITVGANQIVPLRIENGKIIDVAIVSEKIKIEANEKKKYYYIEIHELEPKGYQITNKYVNDEGKELELEDGIVKTFNTLSQTPLFAICKTSVVNQFADNLGLGMSIFGNALDQLQVIDLTYNNFGSDFRLGQKVMVVNKKLTQEVFEDIEQPDGTFKSEKRIIYPNEIQKQLFQEIDTGITADADKDVYIKEYNPDLRVGDNKDGVQFALDVFSFKIGFGGKYYQINRDSKVTATQYVGDNQAMISNGVKNRKNVKEYLIDIIKALKVADRMLGVSADENVDVDIPDVDGFLEDDDKKVERARIEVGQKLLSKMTYLTKYKGLSEKEATEELQRIADENKPITEFGE